MPTRSMTLSELYVYRIRRLVRVVDGDTYDLVLDAGFHLSYAHRFRLFEWDTPEVRAGTDWEKQQAGVATTAVVDWFANHQPLNQLRVRTHKADSFGRWLADVFHLGEDGQVSDLGDHLAGLELATAWPTRWRDRYDRE